MAPNKLKDNRRMELPPMNTIFGVKRNPIQDNIGVKEMIEHEFNFSLMSPKDYNKIKNITELTAHVHPFCTDIKRYVNLARMMQVIFIYDDHIDCEWGELYCNITDSQKIWGQFYECIDKVMNKSSFISMAKWKPYIVAQYIAFEEIYHDHYNEDQMRRLLQAYKEYADGMQRKINVLKGGSQLKTLDQYFKIRIYSVGSMCLFAMVEYADNINLTDQEWHDPLMKHYMELGSIVILLANDMMSFEKELVQNQNNPKLMFNAVALKMIWNSFRIDQAILEVLDLFYNYEKKTKVVKQQLLDKYNENKDVMRFIESIDFVIGGHFKACFKVTRYSEPFPLNK